MQVYQQEVQVREQQRGADRPDPYTLAAKAYKALTGAGWDRNEAAEMIDWLLGQGATASQKEAVLQEYIQRNGLEITAGGGGK